MILPRGDKDLLKEEHFQDNSTATSKTHPHSIKAKKKKKKRGGGGWGFSSVVERLPRKRKALGSVPSSEKKKKSLTGFSSHLGFS